MRRFQAVVSLAAGALTAASAGAHAFAGWPQFRTALRASDVPAEVVGALAVGWYFASVSILAFGLIALLAGAEGLRSGRPARAPLGVMALSYLTFGTTAFVAQGFNPHFLLFVFLGLLLGVGALPLRSPDSGR